MSGHSIATAASWPHGVGRKPLNVWGLNLTCSGRVQCAMTIIKSPSIQQTWLNHGFLQPAARSPEPPATWPRGSRPLLARGTLGPTGRSTLYSMDDELSPKCPSPPLFSPPSGYQLSVRRGMTPAIARPSIIMRRRPRTNIHA